jgi:hypothetical protein
MEYGNWWDWLLCLGIAVLLGARWPMRNREGHSPKYWRKHQPRESATPPLPTSISPLKEKLNPLGRSSIEAYIFFFFAIAVVILAAFNIPINFTIGCTLTVVVMVCALDLWFRSPWTIKFNWPIKTLGIILIIVCFAALVSAGYKRTRPVAPPPSASVPAVPTVPDLQYLPLNLTAMGGLIVGNHNQGMSSSEVTLVFEGKVINNGAPSVTNDWRCKVILPNETIDKIGRLWAVSPDNDNDIIFVDPAGKKSSLPFSAYLPNLTATKPIPQGGSQPGFVAFSFPQLVKHKREGALNGARVILSFRDNTGRQYIYDQTLGAGNWRQFEDNSELVPGMPRPHRSH